MGDLLLKCPLCCSAVFNSKRMLVDHLSKVWFNLRCPVCNDESSSIANMIEHLNQEKCIPKTKIELTAANPIVTEAIHNISEESSTLQHHNLMVSESQPNQMVNQTQDMSDVSRMYVELLSKQLAKPCLQTQELKLVKEDGESRYVIVTQGESLLKTGNTVFTKQNSDGTISLTTVKDMKTEPDPIEQHILTDNEPEESQEIYSCNTCGVSFSSVIEHIQNYHNDQDVVVEESLESCQLPIDYEQPNGEEMIAGDQQTSRRVITDTGDIVEAPMLLNATLEDNNLPIKPITTEQLVVRQETKPHRPATTEKMLVQVDSVVRNLKNKEDTKKGPYHKVVVKEMQMLDGGNKVKVYNCMTCSIYVTTLDEFKSHPCKPQKFKCPHCTVAYENSKSLSAHMKIHKGHTDSETTGPFKCDVCSTVFPSNKSLKLHKRMHDPIKARPIELPVETEGSEPSSDKYVCSICDKVIPIDYRAVHLNSHSTNNKYNCDICNRKFHSSDYLEMHMSVHNLDKVHVNKQDKSLPYNCTYCSRQFARPHEKVKHERIHTGEKPHTCEICGKSFRVSYCLTLHMRTHTGARPYACPHCNKRFKAHSVYNHHLLTHSEVRAYKCPFCPKAFKTSVQLAGHKNSHTKPFSCQHCNRPFASLYAVRAHTETHARQNNLKFSCTLCGASYARTFALKDHIKQVHSKELNSIDKTTVDLKEEGWILSEGDADAMQVSLDKTVPNEINQLVINTNEAESVMIYK